MTENIIPEETQFDFTQPARRIDTWGKRIVRGFLKKISWGWITLIEGAETTEFGGGGSGEEPEVALTVKHPAFYGAVMTGGSVALAEAYIAGIWSAGDLTDFIRILVRNLPVLEKAEYGTAWINRPVRKLFHLFRKNTRLGSRKNILAHYDLGNEFYKLFLDETMTYSCGIFPSESSTLAEASRAKYDSLCRKLKLRTEDHVVEIGTGWGGFAVHAAENYGCRITTTTISDRQYEYACDLVKQKGLGDRIELLKKDYRDISGTFDKLVSIEMVEAVGHEFLDTFFSTCSSLLKPDGVMALQAITITDQHYRSHIREVDFIKRYIFPGSCLMSVTNMCAVATRATDLRPVHLEDITPHYARTLRMWRERFFERLEEVKAMGFSENFIRMWEYYFCYCEGAFFERYIGDVHMVFTKPLFRGAVPGGAVA